MLYLSEFEFWRHFNFDSVFNSIYLYLYDACLRDHKEKILYVYAVDTSL